MAWHVSGNCRKGVTIGVWGMDIIVTPKIPENTRPPMSLDCTPKHTVSRAIWDCTCTKVPKTPSCANALSAQGRRLTQVPGCGGARIPHKMGSLGPRGNQVFVVGRSHKLGCTLRGRLPQRYCTGRAIKCSRGREIPINSSRGPRIWAAPTWTLNAQNPGHMWTGV